MVDKENKLISRKSSNISFVSLINDITQIIDKDENNKKDISLVLGLAILLSSVRIIDKDNRSHTNIICDGCGKKNFINHRYKCLKCVNFDLCGNCFENRIQAKDHSYKHDMLFILNPISS